MNINSSRCNPNCCCDCSCYWRCPMKKNKERMMVVVKEEERDEEEKGSRKHT